MANSIESYGGLNGLRFAGKGATSRAQPNSSKTSQARRGLPSSRGKDRPLEKVRYQFLSLRHPPERSGFCVNEQAENPRAKVGFSRIMAVLEIADFWHNWSGEGIFLRGFVLRRFSTV